MAWLLANGEVSLDESSDGLGEVVEIADPPDQEGWSYRNGQWVHLGPRSWPMAKFLSTLLLPSEVLAITMLQPDTPQRQLLKVATEIVKAVPSVNLDDVTTTTMLDMLVAEGLLTAARKDRILAGLPPLF